MYKSCNLDTLYKLDESQVKQLCDDVERHKENRSDAKNLTQVLLSLKKRTERTTCVLSLFIKSGEKIDRYLNTLADHYNVAMDIKVRENRLPVINTITRVQQTLRDYVSCGKDGRSDYNMVINCCMLDKLEYFIAYSTRSLNEPLFIIDNKIHTPHSNDNLLENCIDTIHQFWLKY